MSAVDDILHIRRTAGRAWLDVGSVMRMAQNGTPAIEVEADIRSIIRDCRIVLEIIEQQRAAEGLSERRAAA